MKSAEVSIGAVYMAKVSGTLVPVRITRESVFGGWDARNLRTQRNIRIRSARRLQAKVRCQECAPCRAAIEERKRVEQMLVGVRLDSPERAVIINQWREFAAANKCV